jgi:translation initiation factor 2 subunit 2
MENYHELLERARKQLPESVLKKERFEIPQVISMIIGNRTIIKRYSELCNTINRDPKHLLKYLAKELGTQGEIQGNEAVFQGKFSNAMINKKFERYVKEFVLCEECGKPDTRLLKKDRLVMLKCDACGARRSVEKIR